MAFTDLLGFLRSKLAAGQVLTRSGRAIMGVDLSALTSAGHQLPATTNTYDLGATGTTWRRIYLGGAPVLDATDSSGTPGAATINKPSGRSAIALGAAAVVITNSLVTASSKVFTQLRSADATLTSVTVTTGAGTITVTGSAAATAAVVFDWFVVN